MKRKSGVLLPIFSLPGNYGCGNFGKSAYKWVDKLKNGGFGYWQILPFGVSDIHNSPYAPYSSFAGNPLFIDPSVLLNEELVTKDEEEDQTIYSPYLCCYEEIRDKRFAFLKKAALRAKERDNLKIAIEDFIKQHPLIEKSCFFLALLEANGKSPWNEWTVSEPDADDLFAWQFIQYEFHRQWNELHRYANAQGIRIIGDVPFYVSYNSSDVLFSSDQFLLDEKNSPVSVAGVPPDYFSEDGQLWGNPIYDWSAMKANGYEWWKNRLSYSLSLFDGVRLDHFRAISAYWCIPANASSAKEGRWEKGPGKALIDAFSSVSAGKLILAEDLGIIDEEVNELLRYSTYPGMAVIQFGFEGDSLSPHLPHNYKENTVAYTGTHDNNTLLGFLWELDDERRHHLYDYLGYPRDPYREIIRTLFASGAGSVILPVQDLLGFGADTRINTPGKADGNWRYRITDSQIDSIDWQSFAHLNKIYARNTEDKNRKKD